MPGAWTAQDTPSRVIVVSSLAHKAGQIELDDLHYRNRKYGRFPAYGEVSLVPALLYSSCIHIPVNMHVCWTEIQFHRKRQSTS